MLVAQLLHYELFHSCLNPSNILINRHLLALNILVSQHLELCFFPVDFWKPLLSLSVDPDSFFNLQLESRRGIGYDIETSSVLLSLVPFSVICSSVSPEIDSLPTLSIINITTHEDSSIAPLVNTLTVHHIVFPFT